MIDGVGLLPYSWQVGDPKADHSHWASYTWWSDWSFWCKMCFFLIWVLHLILVDQGGIWYPRSIFTFSLFLIEENVSYQKLFLVQTKVITFWNHENTYILPTRTKDFRLRPQKWKYRILKMPTLPKIIINIEFEISKFDIFTSKASIKKLTN